MGRNQITSKTGAIANAVDCLFDLKQDTYVKVFLRNKNRRHEEAIMYYNPEELWVPNAYYCRNVRKYEVYKINIGNLWIGPVGCYPPIDDENIFRIGTLFMSPNVNIRTIHNITVNYMINQYTKDGMDELRTFFQVDDHHHIAIGKDMLSLYDIDLKYYDIIHRLSDNNSVLETWLGLLLHNKELYFNNIDRGVEPAANIMKTLSEFAGYPEIRNIFVARAVSHFIIDSSGSEEFYEWKNLLLSGRIGFSRPKFSAYLSCVVEQCNYITDEYIGNCCILPTKHLIMLEGYAKNLYLFLSNDVTSSLIHTDGSFEHFLLSGINFISRCKDDGGGAAATATLIYRIAQKIMDLCIHISECGDFYIDGFSHLSDIIYDRLSYTFDCKISITALRRLSKIINVTLPNNSEQCLAYLLENGFESIGHHETYRLTPSQTIMLKLAREMYILDKTVGVR